MNYLLDTDVVIDYLNHKGSAYVLIGNLLQQTPLAISVVTLTEVRAGWGADKAKRYLPSLRALFRAIPVNHEIALYAGAQLKTYAQQGITLSVTDTLIAATALLHDYHLVTRNVKDFPMPDLPLLNPDEIA